MSDTEANKKLIRKYVQHFNAGDTAGLRRVCAPNAEIHGVLGWGYDCGRCGARVRGLDTGRISCQRCLAPVACRAIDTAPQVSESAKPAAA